MFSRRRLKACLENDRIGGHYQLVIRSEGYVDTLEVKVELIDGALLDRYSELEKLQNTLRNNIENILGIQCKLSLVEPKSLSVL
jgi:phenylacetate-CoA ligase